MGALLFVGDSLEVSKGLESGSLDSVVTDPPYGIQFMGESWDRGVPGVEYWREFLRVVKPGGHLLAFGGTRTFHRLSCAIEDAGWELRDVVAWVYGEGMPKSYNVGKNMEKRGFTGWDGYGTGLKPAWEPIVVAVKPKEGTYVENAVEHGVSGLNLGECRVPGPKRINAAAGNKPGGFSLNMSKMGMPAGVESSAVSGRWPANFIHDGSELVVDMFPETPPSRRAERGKGIDGNLFKNSNGELGGVRGHDDDGGSAARFFYCAKASPSERGGNDHPTVKPIALVRYLCRLVKTPSGGVIFDPFMGSGTTGVASFLEGCDFIGVDISRKYCDIANKRMSDLGASVELE